MPDLRSSLDVPSKHWAAQASMLAVVVVTAATALCGVFSHASGHAPAVAASTAQAQAVAAGAVGTGVAEQAQAADASASTELGPATVAPRVVVHTMSMDAPIQGGLTAHQEQSVSARVLSSHHDVTVASPSAYWTKAEGRSAVARAESWIGMPYSWAGGNAAGPTLGRCDAGSGGDLDCHVVGFDCSGLSMYAWGVYTSLPHLADAQRTAAGAFHPTVAQLLPGDLVFFAGYLPGGTGHVAIYAGHGTVIEAPESGSVIRRTSLADVMAADGAYRGAVRPLTGATPKLTAPSRQLTTHGGTVTLHGTDLAGVDAVHLDGVTVHRFAQHTNSAIVFRAPAHHDGTVAVAVSTRWHATSRSVPLRYIRPSPSKPASAPSASSTAPVSLPSPSPSSRQSASPTPTPVSLPTTGSTTTSPARSTSPSASPSPSPSKPVSSSP